MSFILEYELYNAKRDSTGGTTLPNRKEHIHRKKLQHHNYLRLVSKVSNSEI